MADKKGHRKLRRMEIEPAENGGHTVRHHYKEKIQHDSRSPSGIMMGHSEPEAHTFGPHEGHDMLAHVANALAIPEQDAAGEGEAEEEGQEQE